MYQAQLENDNFFLNTTPLLNLGEADKDLDSKNHTEV